MDTMLGFSTDSSWKCTLAAMSSFENSLGVYVLATTGAVKRGQRALQLCRKEGSVRAADRVSESCTAAQKRVHRSLVSCCVVPGMAAGGVRERMRTKSALA
jgi:hypothetical protein